MEMLTDNGYPSKHLKGEVGQHYKDLETGDIFECVSANKHSRINLHQTGGYIWKKVAHGEHVEVCGGGSGGGWDAVIEWNNGEDTGAELPAWNALDKFSNSTGLYSVLHPMLKAGEMPKILLHCIYYDNEYHAYYTPTLVQVDNWEETDDVICVFVLSAEPAGFTMRRISIYPDGIKSCINMGLVPTAS